MKRIVVHEDANTEFLKAMSWYEEQQAGLGGQLRERVEEALDRLASDPNAGARFNNSRYRFLRTKQFPYVIYYCELADYVWVVAVAHARQRPHYWRLRKPD